MAKTITITFEDRKYTLGFTRDTVRQMESAGFNINNALDTPLTSIETLFTGAFLAHEGRAVKNRIPEKIIKNGLPKEMFGKLIEMYNEPLEAMFEQGDDGEGNLEWEAQF